MTKHEKAIVNAALAVCATQCKRSGLEPISRARQLVTLGFPEEARLLRACVRYRQALEK